MKTIIKILITTLTILFISCVQETKTLKVHKLEDGSGYCYQNEDDMLWYLLIYNSVTDSYDVQQTSTPSSYSETTETVDASNFEQTDMAETTGEDTGGSDIDSNVSDSDSGMSESSGSDSGGSDGGE